jgi:ABC-type sugar transport system ATPase subunit
MGENGAGKSTLMKIVAGMVRPDGGEFLWRGARAEFRSPRDAAAAGIAMVHQESLLAGHLTVAENIFLGREPQAGLGWVARGKMTEEAARLIEQYGFPLDATAPVNRLSPAGKQLVEICRAIRHGASLLIFDEPTSSLSEHETRAVFRIVDEFKRKGAGVIYITHRLDELRSLGDRVTVLRDGETAHTSELQDLTLDQLIRHMVGREVSAIYERKRRQPGEILLRVTGLSRKPLLRDVSLTVRAGEIVGLAGLIGAGRTELCRAIFGVDPCEDGAIALDGKPFAAKTPGEAVRAGIALIPEDRQRTGLATGLPILQNITLANMDAMAPNGIIRAKAEREATSEMTGRLRIKCEGGQQLAGRLSGGNQQKVAIAKWLARGARVFLFDEPTRGIDIGAKAEVFGVMDELARQGAAILMVSSELPELLQMADRIYVMRQGRIAGELAAGCTQEEILRLAAFEGAA